MTASNQSNRNQYDWDAWTRVCSDMTETSSLPLTLIWLRRLDPNVHRLSVTDMTETPHFFGSLFLSVPQSQMCKIEKRKQFFWVAQSYLCKIGPRRLRVISVSTVSFVSQSYNCKLWFKRLNHISLSGTLRVSLISVSFRSFWRSHVRYPLYMSIQSRQFILEWFWSTRICSEQLFLADGDFWLDQWWLAIRSNGSVDWIPKLRSWGI